MIWSSGGWSFFAIGAIFVLAVVVPFVAAAELAILLAEWFLWGWGDLQGFGATWTDGGFGLIADNAVSWLKRGHWFSLILIIILFLLITLLISVIVLLIDHLQHLIKNKSTFLPVMLDEVAKLLDRLVIGVKLQIQFPYLQCFFVFLIPNKQEKLSNQCFT